VKATFEEQTKRLIAQLPEQMAQGRQLDAATLSAPSIESISAS
jgi:hypothetical protein